MIYKVLGFEILIGWVTPLQPYGYQIKYWGIGYYPLFLGVVTAFQDVA